MKFNGEGIQHVALLSDDCQPQWTACRAAGDAADDGAAGHRNTDARRACAEATASRPRLLQSRGILLDGTTEGGQPRLLLQIFSECLLGPVFFEEFIQHARATTASAGNFKALFESMERDQLRREVLQAEMDRPKQTARSPVVPVAKAVLRGPPCTAATAERQPDRPRPASSMA
ncbi:MAG: hypothetical protein R3E34_08165 [Rhodocyclaceae bacterium]